MAAASHFAHVALWLGRGRTVPPLALGASGGTGSGVSAGVIVLTPADLGGLADRRVPPSAARTWSGLLSAVDRGSTDDSAATRAFLSPASPTSARVGVIARVLVAPNEYSAVALARAVRGISSAAAAADPQILGLSARALAGAVRVVWRQGRVVGQLVYVGTGGAFGSGYRASLLALMRARAQALLARTAWDVISNRVRPDGGLSLRRPRCRRPPWRSRRSPGCGFLLVVWGLFWTAHYPGYGCFRGSAGLLAPSEP